jgi:tyrosyl-tRNA synthetase
LQRIGALASSFSVAEFISRDNIKKRLDEGKRVSLREMLYPLMQGCDSVEVEADVELGGTDQRFNLLAGRTLQKAWDQEPQDILMTNLILGTDGRKMSSSWGNTINLLDTPNDMFGKCMSIPDEIIMDYFTHCTRVPMEDIAKLAEDIITGSNPRDAKVRLAKEIVTLYHGTEAGVAAEQYFIDTFSKGQVPTEMPSVTAIEGMAFTELLVAAGVAVSKGEARRKIEQGGVSIGDTKLEDFLVTVTKDQGGAVVKVGKKDFFRIVF